MRSPNSVGLTFYGSAVYFLKPLSISERIVSEREGEPFSIAHPSIDFISAAGKRSATSGSLPVAGRPLFLGITFIDFFAISGYT